MSEGFIAFPEHKSTPLLPGEESALLKFNARRLIRTTQGSDGALFDVSLRLTAVWGISVVGGTVDSNSITIVIRTT